MVSYFSMIHSKPFYLFSVMLFACFRHTELLSLPGCPGKCGNLTIPFPFGLNSDCYFDDSFHIICNSSFQPPKPFLRLGSAEVLSISLDGKIKILNSSSEFVGLEKREGESVPMVVAWAAGSVACHVAQSNASRYACRSPHSQCKDSSIGQGYICRCLPGYRGNPYLLDGCQDIDECAVSNPCEGVCINLPGSFKCYCLKGSVGDGRKDGTGCHPEEGKNIISAYLGFPIGLIVVTPMLAVGWIAWTGRQKKLENLREGLFDKNGGNKLQSKLSRHRNTQLNIYTAEEMKSITNSYSNTRDVMLGCSPGPLYHGVLPENNSTEVVVAIIERIPQSQIEQFVDQLIFLSQPHNNLVRIRGCCLETQSPLIVYELHGDWNATLFDRIHSKGADTSFTCGMRVRVAARVARGVAYLNSHKYKKARFVHGNICSANILMNSSYEAKIFYAAGSNLITRGTDNSSSDQKNYAYNDPELISSGCLNKKSDVYSFGVLLVELLTGGKTLSQNRPEKDRSMALDFVYLAKVGRLREILDEEIIAEADSQVVRDVAALALRCLSVKPGERPKMKEVEAKLRTLMDTA